MGFQLIFTLIDIICIIILNIINLSKVEFGKSKSIISELLLPFRHHLHPLPHPYCWLGWLLLPAQHLLLRLLQLAFGVSAQHRCAREILVVRTVLIIFNGLLAG